jgi:ribosomal protein S18 acetylase RimI-like enzyme
MAERPGPDVAVTVVDESNWRVYKEVRLAQLLDAPRAFGGTYEQAQARTNEEWLERLRTMTTWLAMRGDEPLGSIALYRYPEQGEREACLIGMWVAPAARGQRVGELLVRTLLREAADRGLERVTLDVADENAPAIGLYERTGFERTGRTGHLEHDASVTEFEMARAPG